tara:strand:- start:3 stop:968 length:966 start_codon:yes stop_codon:yes gene_type:complete
MAKNFTDVNANNNHILVRATTNGSTYLTNQEISLTKRNNKSIFDLATDFSDQMIAALTAMNLSYSITLKPGTLKPAAAGVSTDNIIEFTLQYTGNQLNSQSPAAVYVQMFSQNSDSYELLGGDRIEGTPVTNSTKSSIYVHVSSTAKEIYFQCLYPAQRSTTPFLYLRAPGVLNTNIETKGLKDHSDDHKSDTAHSDILGRVVVESSEWIQFTAQTGREFFLDIHQKQLNFLRLRLTDSHNRPIARTTNSLSNTATGTGFEQSTLGNLNFSAVIRFDIIKKRTVQHLESEHYVPNIPARFSNGIVNKLRDGENTFGKSPGY